MLLRPLADIWLQIRGSRDGEKITRKIYDYCFILDSGRDQLVAIDSMTLEAVDTVKRKASSLPGHDASHAGPSDDRAPSPKKPKISRRKYKQKAVDATSPLGVLQLEIRFLLQDKKLSQEDIANNINGVLNDPTVECMYHRTVLDVEILRLTSNGDGLALVPHPDPSFSGGKVQVCVVPFGLPGDVCTVRIFKTHPAHVELDLLQVQSPGSLRDDSLIGCRYFGRCSGCQYQNVEHGQQLVLKRQTIENAFRYFAPKIAHMLPKVLDTQPSPQQYRYRTKLTPHFNVSDPRKTGGIVLRPNLGFAAKGRPTWRPPHGGSGQILDIEECAIASEIINRGLKLERAKFDEDFKKYRKGATILLRENTLEYTNQNDSDSSLRSCIDDQQLFVTYTTNSREIVQEFVNGHWFEFSAGEFFQNNNGILPIVLNYVRKNLDLDVGQDNFLVDAYCGLGLFSILCAEGVHSVIGVEISADSIKFAERNAKRNQIENATFIAGKAEAIFESIKSPNHQTLVILDPPRKGCDDVFLNQLLAYYPARIVYVSCNVHSQARDIQWFLTETEKGKDYEVLSIKGFDFFPQTHHVESVAVLQRTRKN